MTSFQPKRFGKYLLVDKLPPGGMSQLYKAKITGVQGFEKLIAIKTILPHLSDERELITSFIDEAKLAALLHHQNIVQIYDFGNMEDTYFISMEYLFGQDLRYILRKSKEKELPLSLEFALYVASRICAGLDYAHNLKDFQGRPLSLIHRDISPQNIIVTHEGEVKIVDFGIAKAARRTTVTQVGMIKGKIAYMSPEQASGKTIDHRSDIFSTGILLYEMVTGKQMFTGADTLQVLAKVSKAEFEPPEVAQSGLPPKIYDILHKALRKDSEDRYPSCGEMLADLEECMFQLNMRPTTRGLSRYMKELFREEIALEGEAMKEAVCVATEEEPPPKKTEKPVEKLEELEDKFIETPKTKRRAFLYGMIGAALVIIVVVVYALVRERPGSPPPPDPIRKAKTLQTQAEGIMDKNPEEAKSLLLKAIQLDPKSGKGYFNLGKTYTKLMDYPKAIESYQRSAELDPNFPDTYFNLGYIYYAIKKEFSKAEEMFNRVVSLNPPYLDEALFNLGVAQEKLGKKALSIKNLERALSVNPKNKRAKEFLEKLKGKS